MAMAIRSAMEMQIIIIFDYVLFCKIIYSQYFKQPVDFGGHAGVIFIPTGD